MACSMRATSQSSRPVGNWMPYKSVRSMRAKSRSPIGRHTNTLPGSGTDGIPYEGHWSCINWDASTVRIISAQHTVYSMRVASQPLIRSGAGHQNRSGMDFDGTDAARIILSLQLGLLHANEKSPLRLYSKTGLENEDMPPEGCRQNRSAVSQTPVPLDYF